MSASELGDSEQSGAETVLRDCWSCDEKVSARALFCHGCGSIQAPAAMDNFARLGLARGFDIADTDLDRQYFGFQRALHPDRFVGKSAKEQAISLQHATSINDAYECLKDTLKRAAHLLEISGYGLPEDGETTSDPELLMEAMEMRESLAEAVDSEELGKVIKHSEDAVEHCVEQLREAFEAGNFEHAKLLALRLTYLTKLAQEARQAVALN